MYHFGYQVGAEGHIFHLLWFDLHGGVKILPVKHGLSNHGSLVETIHLVFPLRDVLNAPPTSLVCDFQNNVTYAVRSSRRVVQHNFGGTSW